MKTTVNDLDVNAQIALSKCCNAPVYTVIGGFSTEPFCLCKNCNKETETVWKPRFEKIEKGHYRRIVYKIDYNINQI